MRLLHQLLLQVAALMLWTETLHASEPLHFARISYSPIQNVGEKVVKEIYRKAGIEMTVTELPAKRAAYEASMGERDGEIMRIFCYQDEKPQLYRVPYSIGEVKTQIFVRESDSHIRVEGLSSYSVAVVRGVKHVNTYVEDFPHVMQVEDVAKAMKLLSKRRVDAVVVSQLNGQYEINIQNLTDIVPLSKPVVTQDLFHYINKKHSETIREIEAVLKTMHDSGELKTLWNKYVEKELGGNEDALH